MFAFPLSLPELFVLTPILLLIVAPLYFLPAFLGRKKRNARAILALNILLGWTLLGWCAALVWALLRDQPETATGRALTGAL